MFAVQANRCSPREHRHREDDVVEVGHAAVEGVVGDEDVAWRGSRPALVQLDDPLHGLVEHPDEGRDAGAGGDEIRPRHR